MKIKSGEKLYCNGVEMIARQEYDALKAELDFNLDNKIVRQDGKLFQHGGFRITAGYGGWLDYCGKRL